MVWLIDLSAQQDWALEVRRALSDQGMKLEELQLPVPGSAVGIVLADRESAELLAVLLAVDPSAQRVIVIGPPQGTLDPWRVLGQGASECVAWNPAWGAEAVGAWVDRTLEIEQILDSNQVRTQLRGTSRAVRSALRELVIAARYGKAPILIQGETGTGKELAARVAHGQIPGTKGNLVVVDCATIVPTLMGSELFGHERGAFTGAVGVRTGACAAADQGTLFLDEIGELPLDMQPELLRVVQEGTYKRVGGDRWLRSSFRLICATNRDLREDVAAGRFRADLYHRIAAAIVTMPPLRERREDVLELFRHFCRRAGASQAQEIDPAVEQVLLHREYPGNLRDLRQLAARVAARHVGPGPITAGDLPLDERPTMPAEPATNKSEKADGQITPFQAAVRWALEQGLGLGDIKEGIADVAVALAVEDSGGKVHRAAQSLGISDRAVQLRLARKGPGSSNPAQEDGASCADSSSDSSRQ